MNREKLLNAFWLFFVVSIAGELVVASVCGTWLLIRYTFF